MKEKELVITLIKELFEMDELHETYKDDNTFYAIDSQKEGNTLTINVTLKENSDKKEFENWVNDLDDDIFNETWETLSEEFGLKDLNEAYNTENYKEVIDKFKSTAKQIAESKILELKSLFDIK